MAKRALIVWGGWDGHTPRECAEIFAPRLESHEFEVVIRDSLDAYLDGDLMRSLNLLVPIWTMGTITSAQWQGLHETVRSGVGLAGFHGGLIDAFRDNTEYQWMTGGQWVAHPGGDIGSYQVQMADTNHEITAGIGNFTLTDTEQYYVHVDPGNHVLCTTTFSGEHGDRDLYRGGTVMPYAWTKQWGRGRVFVACWGHTFRDFEVPEARQVVERGMLWAAKKWTGD